MEMNHVKHTVPAQPVSSRGVLRAMPREKLLLFLTSFHVSVSHVQALHQVSLVFLIVYSTILGLWSVLQRDRRRRVLPVGLHHWSYGAANHSGTRSVLSHRKRLAASKAVDLLLSVSPDSFGHCASSHPPRLGIARRRILPQ